MTAIAHARLRRQAVRLRNEWNMVHFQSRTPTRGGDAGGIGDILIATGVSGDLQLSTTDAIFYAH